LDSPFVVDAPSVDGYTGCALVSATTFAWAEPSQVGTFDIVVIDEAGQVSLADALITSMIARNVVLLGDPQQLPQVSKGSHPLGSDLSILEHVLGDDATIPRSRGVFLDRSYRMQPEIDAFISQAFYDGRLEADGLNVANRISAAGAATAGPRYVAIEHDGNARRSREEAERIVAEIAYLLAAGTVTIRDRATRKLTPADILVVTPYNVQRALISDCLRERDLGAVGVGTVDKFQGQEAPVVFYSMTTSSAELAPRGLDFLLNPNRLNVAVSRAQALSILVCNPRLLTSRATTIQQMRLLNLVCAYVEEATTSAARAQLAASVGALVQQLPLPL
jgi:superfamily I DNA and/or RNA helicase